MRGAGGINLNIPIYNALLKYLDKNPVSFHMPGHKFGKTFKMLDLVELGRLDLTEIPDLDNLHQPSGVIQEAQELAAKAFGSHHTFFLVNGSTCGIQAAIMSLCKPGDKLILPRDCHRAAVSGMMLSGAVPVYVRPQFSDDFNISSIVLEEDIEKALKENRDAVGVYITRPNYYGICSDIEKISKLVHSHNKVIIVDEAHGAHLNFSHKLPDCALKHNCDICIQSAHKTLPAFTSGAYLHVKGTRVNVETIRYNLGILQTSSPSYLVMAFLDISRAIMEKQGEEDIGTLCENIRKFSKDLSDISQCRILSDIIVENGSVDVTRLVINVKNTGKTGIEVENILRNKYNIQVEMSDLYNIVGITTPGNTREDFENLKCALFGMKSDFKNSSILSDICIRDIDIPEQKVELRELLHKSFFRKNLSDSIGMVSYGMITPYPPGIPLICPGEIISKEAVKYIMRIIEAGGNVNGVERDGTVLLLKGG